MSFTLCLYEILDDMHEGDNLREREAEKDLIVRSCTEGLGGRGILRSVCMAVVMDSCLSLDQEHTVVELNVHCVVLSVRM